MTEVTQQSVGAAVMICKSSCLSVTHAYEQFIDDYTNGKLNDENREGPTIDCNGHVDNSKRDNPKSNIFDGLPLKEHSNTGSVHK